MHIHPSLILVAAGSLEEPFFCIKVGSIVRTLKVPWYFLKQNELVRWGRGVSFCVCVFLKENI